jgi:RNA polymerase sigma-70 factor (ECF subfamily)
VDVPEAEFVAYAVQRVKPGETTPEEAALHWKDLYLACACAAGNAVAIASFERAFFPAVDHAIRKRGAPPDLADDLRQDLRLRLFVGTEKDHPKILDYGGRGELKGWFAVMVMRAVLNAVTRGPREAPFDGEVLGMLLGATEDPDLDYLRRKYWTEFRAAFRSAFEALSAKDQTLLRYAFGKGLTVDALGALYGVHRSTAARWVTKAHDTVLAGARARLTEALTLSPEEYDTLFRLVRSRLWLTLEAKKTAG